MKKIVVIICLLPVFVQAQWKKQITTLDSVLQYLYERQQFNGSILIAENGKVIYHKQFGIADTAKHALTPSSSFNLASVSKQFFTMMAMMLYEEGKLDYDKPVQYYLQNFPYNNITVRQLMNHTSGLPEYFDLASKHMTLIDTLDNAAALNMFEQYKPALVFKPGERFEYCNTNYTTLASIIAKQSGKACEIFFNERIAKPLGLKNTYIYHLKLKSYPSSRVFGFHYENNQPVPDDLVAFDGIVGDGNVYSSAADLYKWDQALYTEKLVKQSTLREAFKVGKLNNGDSTDYGFGWMIMGDTIAHSGGWAGFRTYIERIPRQKKTMITLTNGANGLAIRIIKKILSGQSYQLPQTEIITNVNLIDGTGSVVRHGNLRIVDNCIYDLGDKLQPFPGETVTNGEGQVLSPGFIDNHSHLAGSLEEKPGAIAAVSQGITTIISGQDGGSEMIDTLTAFFKKQPVAVNVATYTGFGTLREKLMKAQTNRPATAEELKMMKEILTNEIKKGSLGLSTGLEYEQEFYAPKAEVIEMAKAASAAGGRYISHIRSEDIQIENAVEEIIEIGREAKIPVQISHIKIAMRGKWGKSVDILSRLEQARVEGINITADCYPYTMWSSTPRVLFPKKDFDSRTSAEFAVTQLIDPSGSVITHFPADTAMEGKTLDAIGLMKQETAAEALLRIIRTAREKNAGAAIVGVSMSETDIKNFLRWNYTNICSDGGDGGHPRGYGAFTRILGKYVREEKIMPLETAIFKMTSLAAEQTGILNRGILQRHYFADLVLFNPQTVKDNSTISDSHAVSSGISKVWVNGKVVYVNGKTTNTFPGKLLKKTEIN
ncbi:MAG: serine hydrolase [Chitinophagaceae bacterium]|nr:serine hydrolase [Chitinophagaceae bacterium]